SFLTQSKRETKSQQASSALGSDMAFLCAYELRCNGCGKSYGNRPLSICDECFSPLEIYYDLESVRGKFTRAHVESGPANIWRYGAMLPIPEGFQPDTAVGFTPLVRAKHLGGRIGASNLYLKN